MKRLAFIAVLCVVVATATAQQAQAWEGAYEAWEATPKEARVAYVNGVVAGATYIGVAFIMSHEEMGARDWFNRNIPFNVPTGYLVAIVNEVYEDRRNRLEPVLKILCEWKMWEERLGRL